MPYATSKRISNERIMHVSEQLERRKIGPKVDLLFKTDNYELGMAVAGETKIKSLLELNCKTPKILKDMLIDLVSESQSTLRKTTVFGFVIFGL